MGEILSQRNMKLVCFVYHRQGGIAKAGKGRKRPCGALRATVQNPLHYGDNWGGLQFYKRLSKYTEYEKQK